MKLILAVALAILASVHAGEDSTPEHEYMYFPDGDGNLHLIDLLETAEDLTADNGDLSRGTRNVNSVTFNLFTRNNPTSSQLLVLNDANSVARSNFFSTRPTRFITHGWRSDQNSDACTTIRDAYLSEGDYNVIVIDWSPIAGNLIYPTAALGVYGVADTVGDMLTFLRTNSGLNFSTTKLIGHSLGAHVSGLAARSVKGLLSRNVIQAVIGLDPALPGFNLNVAGLRIHKTDAEHVQIIHTNGGLLGIMDAIGDTDFYPNGGSSQPGCILDVSGACAHARAYYYFAESILNPTGFPAIAQRSSYIDTLNGQNTVYMGGRVFHPQATGSFTLTTNRRSPFAQG